MKSFPAFIPVVASLLLSASALATAPDKSLTPGALCTPKNPDFVEYRYKEHIAYCKRNVPKAEKEKVAEAYGGIPESEWENYEFDHLIPLSIGGSSEIGNIWPQPIDEAKQKDKVEEEVYQGMRDGTMTQKEAIDRIWKWIDDHSDDDGN